METPKLSHYIIFLENLKRMGFASNILIEINIRLRKSQKNTQSTYNPLLTIHSQRFDEK